MQQESEGRRAGGGQLRQKREGARGREKEGSFLSPGGRRGRGEEGKRGRRGLSSHCPCGAWAVVEETADRPGWACRRLSPPPPPPSADSRRGREGGVCVCLSLSIGNGGEALWSLRGSVLGGGAARGGGRTCRRPHDGPVLRRRGGGGGEKRETDKRRREASCCLCVRRALINHLQREKKITSERATPLCCLEWHSLSQRVPRSSTSTPSCLNSLWVCCATPNGFRLSRPRPIWAAPDSLLGHTPPAHM